MEKLLKGRENPKKGDSVGNGDAVSLGIFSSWGVANVTAVTFNYILVIVFVFPLNVDFSPWFHCTVLVPVHRVHTSCFHNTVVSSWLEKNIGNIGISKGFDKARVQDF